MSNPIPHVTPPVYPSGIPSTRLAARIHSGLPVGCRVAILGLADDLGVRLNHGRPGAKHGPKAFRDALAAYGIAQPHSWDWPKVFDAGDIIPADGHDENALHETHQRVTEATHALLDLGLFPIAIGGGHDLTYPFARALARRFGKLSGIYFDAHLDVRETVGSGMPFRKLLEEQHAHELHLFGFNPFVNSQEHVRWFQDHAGHFHACGSGPGSAPRRVFPGELFLSFDLDVLDSAHAPGVSALNPAGLSVAAASEELAHLAASPRLRGFDIMELNPAHDIGGRTARAAAHLFLTVLRAIAPRFSPEGA